MRRYQTTNQNVLNMKVYFKQKEVFYKENNHIMKVMGGFFVGPAVYSGVRQGCPLSGLLFALCVDVLLVEFRVVLTASEQLGAFADDIAAAIADYRVSLPILAVLFQEFHIISALQLNVRKTIFIGLWPVSGQRLLRDLLKECNAF